MCVCILVVIFVICACKWCFELGVHEVGGVKMVDIIGCAIGLVVKYLVAIEMPRVRFPDGAIFCFIFVLHLVDSTFLH